MAYEIQGIHFEQSDLCLETLRSGTLCPLPPTASDLRRIKSHESPSLVTVAGRVTCQRARLKIVQQTTNKVVTRCPLNAAIPFCGTLEFEVEKSG